jgi:ubiquinone/menaquinone biosynthesis C-methylase UbiE
MHVGRAHDLVAELLFVGQRRRVYRRLAALSRTQPGDNVLDVGCGDGYLTRIMADAAGPSGSAHGVDPSAEAITRARHVTGLPNCTYSEGIAQDLEAPDESYDVVVTGLMLHHLPETERSQAVAEMRRVLRPGGRLLIAEFRPPTSRLVRRLIRRIASPAMQHNPINLIDPMVSDAGFEQVQSGDVRPWIRYVRAVKPSVAT